jgi:cytochrome b
MQSHIRVWDLPVRLFHWALVALFGIMWYTGKTGGTLLELHVKAGLAIAILLLFRIIWGFIGSETARFSHFLKGPGAVKNYLAGRYHSPAVGHNPLGGWMVVFMLLALCFQVVSGLFSSDVDSFLVNGPLAHIISSDQSETVTGWHTLSFTRLLVLAGVHLSAIIGYRVFKKQNLVRAMITGRALHAKETSVPKFAPPYLALLSLAVSAGGLYWLIR